MSNRRIILGVLLVAGLAGLAALERRNATTAITPRPLLHLVADTERELERLPLELTRVTADEENAIGQELARQYGFHFRQEESPETKRIAAYISSVGDRLAVHVKRKGIRYRFHYRDEPRFVNAFAMPGGQIVFGRGLLELLESEDELAAILGHEIAHVDEHHSIERLQYELKSRKMGLRGLYRLGRPAVLIFEAGYTKEKEAEADRAGLALAVAAGYSPGGAVDVMKRFERFQGMSRQAASPLDELLTVPLQSLQEYFRSHPPPRERIATLEKEIAARGWNASQARRPLPMRAIFLADSAQRFHQRGLYARAIALYQQALRLDPDYVAAWRGLALSEWKIGDAPFAAETAVQALKRDPENEATWNLLVEILAGSKPTTAPEQFQQLTAGIKPKGDAKDLAWHNLAVHTWRMGEAAAAARAAIEALRQNPTDQEMWRLLPRALAAADLPSAPARFQGLIGSLHPDEVARLPAQADLAGLQLLNGRAEALESYTGLLRRNPRAGAEAIMRRRMAWWMYRAGRHREAAAELEAARQRQPGYQEPLRLLAFVLSDLGRQADADNLRSAGGGEAEGAALQALIEWRTEAYGEARNSFHGAATTDTAWMVPRWVRANYSAAAADVFVVLQAWEFDGRGDFARAIELYREALRKNPSSFPAWEGLALATWRAGDAPSAAEAATNALQRNPGARHLWHLLARALAAADPRGATARFQETVQRIKPPQETPSYMPVEVVGLDLLSGRIDALENYRNLLRPDLKLDQQVAWRRRMAWWMYRANKTKEARVELQAVLKQSSQSSQASSLMAWVETDFGRQADAEMWRMRRGGVEWELLVHRQEPTAQDAALAALILWRSNKKREAQLAFQRAAESDPVWMVGGWIQGNFSATAAQVFAELRTAELVRREQEAAARAGRLLPKPSPAPR